MSQKHIPLLRQLLAATQAGKIKWQQAGNDIYVVSSGENSFQIRFMYLLLPDETTTGADIVQITLPGCMLTYCSGTEGMDIIVDILSAAFDEWREHQAVMDRSAAYAEDILQKINTANI